LSKGEVDFGLVPPLDDKKDEPKSDEDKPDEATVIAAVKLALGERVSDVRASQRLPTARRRVWSPRIRTRS